MKRRATRLALLCAGLFACGSKTGLLAPDPLADAGDTDAMQGNVGREYWTISTANSNLGAYPDQTHGGAVGSAGFPFAIAVENPTDARALVSVEGGALGGAMSVIVEPGAMQVLTLPWVESVSQTTQAGADREVPATSVFAQRAAYHVRSTTPVAVYQFNPLGYQDTRQATCTREDPQCFSYTNDSSLLLPVNALAGKYTVVAWPSSNQGSGNTRLQLGGFVTIVATQENTRVTVRLTGGVRGGPGVDSASPGQTLARTMHAGDVWQLVSAPIADDQCVPDPDPMCGGTLFVCSCVPYPAVDLTGTTVDADAPVAVFAGHDCADVPTNRPACDHLEEQLFPDRTLGVHYVVSRTRPVLSGGEPNLVRVVSAVDDNRIEFTPMTVHEHTTLARGQWIEFTHRADFEVHASGPVVVAQYLVGQGYFDAINGDVFAQGGDPSMALEVPQEQWRASYAFLTPASYPRGYVNVVAPRGTGLTLDGAPLSAMPEPAGAYDVYREDLSDRSGPHHIESTDGTAFAIKVYGFGQYTSYMNPGGLDLHPLR